MTYNPPLPLKLSAAVMGLLNLGGMAVIYFMAVKNKVSPSDFIAFNTSYGLVSGAFSALIGIVPQIGQMRPLLRQAKPIMEVIPRAREHRPANRLEQAVRATIFPPKLFIHSSSISVECSVLPVRATR